MSEAQPPLVSIVIPCFNYAHYVGQAIESALAQTYPHVEVIAVDDGSTDNSTDVIGRYPVRLHRQRNQGLSASTNAGARLARGEFLVRLDADDVLYPDFVQYTVKALQARPGAVLAHTHAEYFGDRSGPVPFKPFDPEWLAQGAYATCTALFRLSAWRAVGGLDETIPLCEDWDLWLTFAERGLQGIMLPMVLWGYRQHGPSMVRRSLRSRRDLAREYRLIAHLQDHHASIFAPTRLVGRLAAAPCRVMRGEVAPHTAAKLALMYSVMLYRVATRRHRRLGSLLAGA